MAFDGQQNIEKKHSRFVPVGNTVIAEAMGVV